MMFIAAVLLLGVLGVAGQATVPAGDVEKGKTVYATNGCAECHGLEGQGAPTSGPRIAPNPLPLAAFIKYVRAPKNQMPPYTAKVMSDEQLRDVRAFLDARPKPTSPALLAP
jgi:mono/diheme cytochrome c family protein